MKGPGFFTAVLEMVDLSWRQTVRSKQLIGVGLVILFAAGIAFAIQGGPRSTPVEVQQMIQILVLSPVVVPLIALLFGTGALATERESGTLTYLFTRPFPRSAVVIGKGVGAIAAANAAVVLAVLLVWISSSAPAGSELGGAMGALMLETTALTALFVLFGTVAPKSVYLGLAYIAFIEGFAGNTLGARSGWTVTYHARNLLSEWSAGGIGRDASFVLGLPGPASQSVLVLVVLTVIALAAAALWVETREYGLRDRSKEE